MSTLLSAAIAGSVLADVQVTELPDLPVAVSGAYMGLVNERVVVAGGEYYPAAPPWQLDHTGQAPPHTHVDTILTLDGDRWTTAPTGLPAPLAGGATVTVDGGMILIGGSNEQGWSPSVFALVESGGTIVATSAIGGVTLQPMSIARRGHGAAQVGDSVYVVGGDTGTGATGDLLSLDLATGSWTTLDPLPGTPRVDAAVAAFGGRIYVIGGRMTHPDMRQHHIADAWRFDPASGTWTTFDPPSEAPIAGAAVAAMSDGLLLIGGRTGTVVENSEWLRDRRADTWQLRRQVAFEWNADMLLETHPGYTGAVHRWTPDGGWQQVADDISLYRAGAVTRSTVAGEEVVVAGGSDRPGHRTARTWACDFRPPAASDTRSMAGIVAAASAFFAVIVILTIRRRS